MLLSVVTYIDLWTMTLEIMFEFVSVPFAWFCFHTRNEQWIMNIVGLIKV